MSFITNLFKKNEDTQSANGFLSDNTPDTKLTEYKISLDKTVVNLQKSTGVSFDDLKSRVNLVLDYSGSMQDMYMDGTVQEVITKILPLALKFDDNGKLDCYLFSDNYIFNDSFKKIKGCTERNYQNYVKDIIKPNGDNMRGTCYAPVIRDILRHDTTDIPTFTIFITDGDNSDPAMTDDVVRQYSTANGFIMFIGIGGAEFRYLRKLDTLDGRPVDNTGFVEFVNIRKVNEAALYEKLLSEYASWLKR